jgi:DNA-directed RNA polymerase subunit RPC12/RpoP
MYGMKCFNCEAEIEAETLAELDRLAVEAKWKMGLTLSAQAYYCCSECGPSLLAATPLHPMTFAA